jgi:hypothetical protein
MLPARNSLGLLSVITSARGTSALWLHKPLHNHLGSIKIRRYGDSITLLAFLWSPPHLCLPFHGALHISACILLNLLIPACIYNLSIIFLEMQIPLISSWAPAHKLNMIAYFSIFWVGQDASSYPLNIIACYYSKFWTKHGACSYPLNKTAYFYSKFKHVAYVYS